MLKLKKLMVFSVVAFFVISFTAMNSVAAEKVFTLGVLGPFTGPAAETGQDMKNAAQMAFDEIDNKIGDYKVKLVYIDDQSSPDKGANAYAEAIERKGVQAGILNWNTSVTVACQPVWGKYKVPHFFCMGAGSAGNQKWASLAPEDRYLIMKGWPIPQKLVVAYSDCFRNYIANDTWKPEKKLVAFWGEDTDWGRSLIGGLAKYLKADGWEVFTEEYFALTQTNFYPFISKCKKAGVTAMCGSSTGAGSISAMIKQSDELGFKAMQVADGLGWIGDWYKLTGRASDGVMDLVPQIVTPTQKAWAERYKKKFNKNPSPASAGMSYDYAKFMAKIAERALKKYGAINSETITKVGREEVATGKMRYGREDGALFHARYGTDAENAPDPKIGTEDFYFPLVQYEKGVGHCIFPESMKTREMKVKK
jgi:branched-chain amino acid transport system substrate-binding protein